ncbi:MAG: hypothetical protein Q7S98_03310, partial [Deltaproteobacteria bacterium]|nr:hypothetical protein [Deltaproteobacteria bacterium]
MFSDNTIVFDLYASNTALLVGSGLCYQMEDAGLQVCFQEDDDIVVDLTHPELRGKGNWDKSYLPQLEEGPWVLSGIRRLLFLGLSPSWTIDEKLVTPDEDGHSLITAVAYHLPDGGCGLLGQEDPDFVVMMRREVGYCDYPPMRTASYVSLLANQFRSAELNERHAVRPIVRDGATGSVKLQGMPETRFRIRKKMKEHLDEIHRTTGLLAQNLPILSEADKLQQFLSKLTKMKEALAANRLPEVVQGIKDLRSVLRYAQESDIIFPNGDSDQYANKEVLEILTKDYNQMAQEIRL